MRPAVDVRSYYRRHDHFKRYSMDNEKRLKELSHLYSSNKRFFGRKVLDLACGAGILGFLTERDGRDYVGIDKNPDMIKEAKKAGNRKSKRTRFLLGDVRAVRIPGKFDTLTLLGNAVIHFDTLELLTILRNVSGNVHEGAHFIVEYRDVVSMLYSGEWNPRKAQEQHDTVFGKVIGSRSIGVDPLSGNIKIQSLVDGRENLVFTHAIWSPFIIQPIMEAENYELVKRRENPRNVWLDVYRAN